MSGDKYSSLKLLQENHPDWAQKLVIRNENTQKFRIFNTPDELEKWVKKTAKDFGVFTR